MSGSTYCRSRHGQLAVAAPMVRHTCACWRSSNDRASWAFHLMMFVRCFGLEGPTRHHAAKFATSPLITLTTFEQRSPTFEVRTVIGKDGCPMYRHDSTRMPCAGYPRCPKREATAERLMSALGQ